jgi:hypothetical protein
MVNTDIFLGSGASLTYIPEVPLSMYIDGSDHTSGATTLNIKGSFSIDVQLIANLYVGCSVEVYDASESTTTPASIHTITANAYDNSTTENQITITPSINFDPADDDSDFIIIQPYGAPCPAKKVANSNSKLNSDNWIGLIESATFPNVEVEMKQLNLSLGGSRNFTHQYKGIETASGGNIGLMANHGAWLYYALGKCTGVKCTSASGSTVPASAFLGQNGQVNQVYIDTADTASTAHDGAFEQNFLSQGPIFYRTGSNDDVMMPPAVIGSDAFAQLNKLTVPTFNATTGAIENPITYRFEEANGADLPSFSLEQSMTKTTLTTVTGQDVKEDESVVRIARGNRVNTLTMTANENEEVKMTMDLNTRTVDFINDLMVGNQYTPRNNIASNTDLFNYTSSTGLEPFFFSDGSFSIFGQQFLKVTNFTLTINNNLQDKRFLGIGNKKIKDALPAQRTYEISFTAMITDDALLTELLNQTEETSSDTIANGLLDLTFDKSNGEQIKLQFKNYFLSAANVTIPDDKGPITLEGTIMPRDLSLCTVKTHFILQG